MKRYFQRAVSLIICLIMVICPLGINAVAEEANTRMIAADDVVCIIPPKQSAGGFLQPQTNIYWSDGHVSREQILYDYPIDDEGYVLPVTGFPLSADNPDIMLNLMESELSPSCRIIGLDSDHQTIQRAIEDTTSYQFPFGTEISSMRLPNIAKAYYGSEWETLIPVGNWKCDNFKNDVAGTYTFTGEYLLYEPYIYGECLTNPLNIAPTIQVKILNDPSKVIVDAVVSDEFVTYQNFYPGPTDKTHASGSTPSWAVLPEATVTFADGHTELMPLWSGFAPYWFLEPGEIGAECRIATDAVDYRVYVGGTVLPAEYEVWIIYPEEISVEVPPGTSLANVYRKLQTERKTELDVVAYNMKTDLDAYLFCDFTLDEETNPEWKNQMDTPGDYILKGTLPDNFHSAAEDICANIKVTVTEPLEITGVQEEFIMAPQSIELNDLSNLPKQVNVTLEDNSVVPVDVEWDSNTYNKDSATDQFVIGNLVNLPSKIKQPEGEAFTATLIVHVDYTEYKIAAITSDNVFTADAGLTLAEITTKIQPKLTVTIESVSSATGMTDITAQYEVDVLLEDEKNPDFDPELADIYSLNATLRLPDNITYTNTETQLFDEVFLETTPVEIESVEPACVLANEGTPFADLELPETVSATLSNGKTVSIPVDWGDGTGYDPSPEGLTDDHPVECAVTGSIVNWPQYINGAGVSADLNITVIKTYTLDSITPAQIMMEVNLGSSLEDIYNLLESHTAQLTLKSYQGDTHTVDVTFSLREEDNSAYDPMTVGTYTLTAYLPLESNVLNPNNLQLDIVVQAKKYTISNIPAIRLSGVVSGTPFEEIGLPEKVDVLRNDGVMDQAPVTWDGSKYNPTKIGSQVVRGTLTAPLPVHLENPNNRQPNAMVTVVNPNVTILSMKQIRDEESAAKSVWSVSAGESLPGFIEHKYEVELQHKDGTITTDLISLFTEA